MPRSTTPPPETTFPGTPFEGRTVDSVKNTLTNQALQVVRNNHEEEFHQVITGLYEAHGLTYKPRLTEEQKAAQQVAALFAAHPGLADQFVPAIVTLDTAQPVDEDVAPASDGTV